MNIVMLESIGISKENTDALAAAFTSQGHSFTAYYERISDLEELKRRVQPAEVLILANMPLPGEVIQAAGKLKMISVAFTGVDHIDMRVCREKNIIVCNAAGYSTHAVAELTFGLLISLIRNIIQLHNVTLKGGTKAGYSQHELFGKTIGIIGTGAIGMRVAEIASAFGMKVIAYSRTIKSAASSINIEYVSLEELLRHSDVVSLHVPLSGETKGLINNERLSLMKKSAVLINTSRGAVIDSTSLAKSAG
jgi:Lactate dehydrogenase and related dehydrogenases